VIENGTPTAVSSLGMSRAEPVPLGESVLAGPVDLRVQDVLVGPDAVAAVLSASPNNAEPRDGTTYVAVQVSARNEGPLPLWISNDDFALTGDSDLVSRFLGAQPPDPALDVTLAPGESGTGWIAFGIPVAETSLLLLFNSLQLGGAWADRVLALQEGASIPDRAERVVAVNGEGAAIGAALGFGSVAVTEQWAVELLDVVSGAPAFDMVDYRTGALSIGDATGEDGSVWVALRFRIQNAQAGGALAWFPSNAFTLVDDAGDPLLDVVTLTPPRPDAAGGYYPGATRDGWVMFDVPPGYTTATVRFLPFAHTSTPLDPRYFAFG
jgi:hypothetical protein